VIQKQKPQRNAEADCLEDNCKHYRTINTTDCIDSTLIDEDKEMVANSIIAMSTAMVYHQYELAVEHAQEIVNAVKRIQQKRDDI
jgi:hypothetical protein